MSVGLWHYNNQKDTIVVISMLTVLLKTLCVAELWEWLSMPFGTMVSCVICTLTTVPSLYCKHLYRRKNGHTWYNKDKEREGQCPVNRSGRWSITINNRYTMVFYQYNIKNVVLWLCRSLWAVLTREPIQLINRFWFRTLCIS
jgi:hypothetical protein